MLGRAVPRQQQQKYKLGEEVRLGEREKGGRASLGRGKGFFFFFIASLVKCCDSLA